MSKLVEYIEEKMMNENFSIDTLAMEMAMSRSVFFKKIKSLTGQNPQEFIRDIKMKKAATLLNEKKYSIGEIAYLTGYPNAKYFSTAFKNTTELPQVHSLPETSLQTPYKNCNNPDNNFSIRKKCKVRHRLLHIFYHT